MATIWEVDSKTNTTYKYSVDGKVVATISGLKAGLKTGGSTIEGITVTEATSGGTGTITLDSRVLNGKDVELTLSKGYKYELGLTGGDVAVTPSNVSKSIAKDKKGIVTLTVKGDLSAGYALKNTTKITYSKAVPGATLTTISGIADGLGVVDGKIGTTTTTGEGDNKVTTLDEELVLLDATTGVVTLKASALAKGNATLKINNSYSPYTALALDSSVAAPELGTGSWSEVKKTASTYTANVTEAGYTLSLDSKTVTYTAEGNDVALVTVSGLKDTTDIAFKTDDSSGYYVLDAKNNRTIVLPADVLNKAAVKISSSKANFLLALDDDVNKSDVANTNIWAISGTKAVYKTVKPEYYTYDSSTNAVSYTKQADVATLATLNGIKKATTDNLSEITENINIVGSAITLGEDALGTSNVTLTNGTGQSYTLALGSVTAPEATPTTWTVSGTTATLNGTATAGWAKTSDTLITYVKPTATNKTMVLATVKGLKSGITLSTEKDSVGYGKGTDYVAGLLENNGVITVSANVLGTSNVTLTPTAGFDSVFSFDLDAISSSEGGAVPTSANTKHFWYIKGKNLLLKNGYAKYYTLTDSKTITETDEVVGSDVATVSGLKTGLKVVDGSIDGITISGKQITLTEDVLNKATVTLTNTNSKNTYSLNIANSLKPDPDSTTWIVEGTTAELVACVSAGYTPKTSNTVLEYSGVESGATLATLTGLKNGLKVVNDKIDGIKDEAFNTTTPKAEKTITLSKNVLGTTDVTLDAVGIDNGYQLAVDSTVTSVNVTREWVVNGTTANYNVTTPRGGGFEQVKNNSDKVVQLAYKKAGTVTTTLNGISSTADGDDFTVSDDGVITLSDDALGGTSVTFKKNPSGYTLALASDNLAPVANEFTWEYDSKTKTTAHLKGFVETPGYELSSDALSVVYTPATDRTEDTTATSTLATVTGLKSGLTAAEFAEGITPVGTVLYLGDSVLAGTKLTVKGGTYTLAINNEKSTKANEETGWVTSGTTATYKTYLTGYYTPDAKGTTVKYTKPTAGTTYATVKGVAKNADLSSIGNNKTVTLTSDMLGTSNVTITGSGYKLALASGVPTSTVNATEWVTSGTTATYKNYNKAYYKATNSKITYYKPTAGTTYATIKGIKSGATIEDTNISTSTDGTVVTLNADQLGTSKVTISGSGYSLALGNGVDVATLQGNYWTQNKNATAAIYKADYSPGYTLANNALSITYSAKPTVTTLATISNITKAETAIDTRTEDTEGTSVTGYTYDDATELISGIAAEGTTITLSDDVFSQRSGEDPKNGAKITLKDNAGQGYKLAISGELSAPATNGDPGWTLNKSKRTITYTQEYAEGVNVADDGLSATYATAKTTTLATISGLDKNKVNAYFTENEISEGTSDITNSLEEVGISLNGNIISLTDDTLIGTGKVTLGKNDAYVFNIDAVKPTEGTNKWSVKGTTAAYNKITTAGYKLTDTKTVTYVKEAVGDNIVTITGLKKGLSASKDGTMVGVVDKTAKDVVTSGIHIRDSVNKIDLNGFVLGTTDIKLTNNGSKKYTFNTTGGKEPDATEEVWSFSNGTATYKEIQNSGYTKSSDGLSIAYTPAKTTTLATVKGLNKTFTGSLESALQVSGESIIVSGDILTTGNATLTLPKNAVTVYSLDLASGIPTSAVNTTEWVTSGTTATYKKYDKAYYTTDPNTGAIVYHKPTAGTTYATIKDIKSGVDINSASGVTDGTVGGTITLTAAMLGNKNVTVVNAKGNNSATYTLALANDVPTSSTKATGWVIDKTTAYYRSQYDTGSYSLNEKGAIVFSKDSTTGTEYARIAGVTGDLSGTFDSTNKVFTLTNSGLSNKITLTPTATEGVADYKFNFNNTYNNAAITASANADTITALGDKLTISGGKGNDNITLGTEDRVGNVIIYNNGEGNDTIVNFTENDALQIKGFKTTMYTGGETVNVGSGSITLEDYEGEYITINNTKYATDGGAVYTAASNVLLADNNYSMDAASLSDIVNPVAASYTPYDFDGGFSLTKEDKLTPQISYSGNDK